VQFFLEHPVVLTNEPHHVCQTSSTETDNPDVSILSYSHDWLLSCIKTTHSNTHLTNLLFNAICYTFRVQLCGSCHWLVQYNNTLHDRWWGPQTKTHVRIREGRGKATKSRFLQAELLPTLCQILLPWQQGSVVGESVWYHSIAQPWKALLGARRISLIQAEL